MKLKLDRETTQTWHLARKGRLTASNFGCVLKAKWVTQSLLKRLLGEYDLSGVKGVQWDVNNEQEALKAFTVLTGKSVQETGIWLDASGILGASPDGIEDDETVLEAKCPYTEKNLTIEEAIPASPTFCLKKSTGWQWICFKEGPRLLGPGTGWNVFCTAKVLLFCRLDF